MSEYLIQVQGKPFDLTKLTVGLGWAVANGHGEIPAVHYPGTPRPHQEHDLDMVALLLDETGKIAQLGGLGGGSDSFAGSIASPGQGDVVFHKAPRHSSGAVYLSGDNRVGVEAGQLHADGEQIVVELDKLEPQYHRIVLMVMIHDGRHRSQNFGMVRDAYVRAMEANDQLIARLQISGNPALARFSALSFAELVRDGAGWKFEYLGVPHESDRFVNLLKPYF